MKHFYCLVFCSIDNSSPIQLVLEVVILLKLILKCLACPKCIIKHELEQFMFTEKQQLYSTSVTCLFLIKFRHLLGVACDHPDPPSENTMLSIY